MHCKSYSHVFSKKFQHICVSLDVNFNESLTNDVISFEQLGPDYRANSDQTTQMYRQTMLVSFLKRSISLFGGAHILQCFDMYTALRWGYRSPCLITSVTQGKLLSHIYIYLGTGPVSSLLILSHVSFFYYSLTHLEKQSISQHFSHTNVQKKIWSCQIKVKDPPQIIICINFVDHLSLMLCTKIQLQQAFFVLEKILSHIFTIYGHGSHLGQWSVTT